MEDWKRVEREDGSHLRQGNFGGFPILCNDEFKNAVEDCLRKGIELRFEEWSDEIKSHKDATRIN